MGRVKVNLTLDADVARAARSFGLNMSRLADAAISEAAKAERNKRWREANKAAIDPSFRCKCSELNLILR